MLENTRILVVEDDPSVAMVCKEALDELGAIATVATSVDDALVVAHEFPLDAIIADVALPDGSVDDLRERLLETRNAARTPLIVMSGYDLRAKYSGDGIWGYLQKPFHLDELERAVAAVIAQNHV